jgi:hypothetical protein
LFLTFHLLAVQAIKIVSCQFYSAATVDCKDSKHLNSRCKCQFSGEETFDQVCDSLGYNVKTINQYCCFLQKIPKLTGLLRYHKVKENKYFIASLLMTVPAFQKFMAENVITAKDEDEESVS